jgi:coenzyme PQQ precursor peptide PqqA
VSHCAGVGNKVSYYIAAEAVTLRRKHMAWTTPTLVEICIGLEINGYLPAEF